MMVLEDCDSGDEEKKCSRLNPDIIGQSVHHIAQMAKIKVPKDIYISC